MRATQPYIPRRAFRGAVCGDGKAAATNSIILLTSKLK
jgi:hypothetical protein